MRKIFPTLLLLPLFVQLLAWPAVARAVTLERVVERDLLNCGVAAGLQGFSWKDDEGWKGLDVDICRAIAAAALGSGEKVRFVPTTSQDRFGLLENRSIDVLIRSSAWTARRDLKEGLTFGGVNFFNGLAIMTLKVPEVTGLADLSGQSVCLTGEVASTGVLEKETTRQGLTLIPAVFETAAAAQEAYEAGRCAAILAEAYSLALLRSRMTGPQQHAILDDYISLEPLGPVVLQSDPAWADFVAWTLYSLIAAEEAGITAADAVQLLAIGESTGLPVFFAADGNDPAADAIATVGNYGEIFERNFADLMPDRGPNALWRNGGLMFTPNFR